MSAALSLAETVLAVDPGGEVVTQVVVRNTGSVVDQFAVEVVGEPVAWATVEPATVSLFPDAEATVSVRFHPPRTSQVLAGSKPFAVKVTPLEQPDATLVEEGTVELAAFSDLGAELLPRTARGRRRSAHEVAVDNRGNARVNAALSAADSDELLEFVLSPEGLVIEPGHAAFAKIRAIPRKRFWWGPPKTRQFQVLVEPDRDAPLLALDGTMVQESRVPRWLPMVLALALLLGIALVALWFTVLRPTLEAAAQQAAEEELAEVREEQEAVAEQAAAAEEAANEASETANDASGAAADAEERAEQAEQQVTGVEGRVSATDLGDPFDFRLTRSVAPGADAASAQTVPSEERYSITDVVLQNPDGDQGRMQVRRRSDDELEVLLEVRLENFRDLDYHFVSPVRFGPDEEVSISVRCDNEEDACNAAAYFTGFVAEVEDDAAEEP